MSKHQLRLAALVLVTVAVFLVTHPAWAASTFADWKQITFHEPAHYIFEFQNEAAVFLIGFLIHKRQVKVASERAIREHDAEYHPRHAHAVNADGTIKGDEAAA